MTPGRISGPLGSSILSSVPVSVVSDASPSWQALNQRVVPRSPLGQRMLRMLGIGADQSWQAWAQPKIDAGFASKRSEGDFGPMPETASGAREAWIAARVLPNADGAFRATAGPSW